MLTLSAQLAENRGRKGVGDGELLRILSQCQTGLAAPVQMTLCQGGFSPSAYPLDTKGNTFSRSAPGYASCLARKVPLLRYANAAAGGARSNRTI